ncbi:MAG: hypothetical protein ACTSVI_11835 [Promethearchaeota archaeon]
MALRFYYYYKKFKDCLKRNQMNLAWFSLFLSYSLMTLTYMFSDFFSENEALRGKFLHAGYILITTGVFFFIYNTETLKIIKTKRVIFYRFWGFVHNIYYLDRGF